jgi:hypothetical protein
MVELTVVQFVLSVLRCNVYVYEPGVGAPSDDGTVHVRVEVPLPAVATKFVGALAVVVTVCCGTTTVTKPPETWRDVASPVAEFTDVNVVTANVITVDPAVGCTTALVAPPLFAFTTQNNVVDGHVVVTAVAGVHVFCVLLQRSIAYPTMALPPLLVGVAQVRVTTPLLSMLATRFCGALGFATGVADAVAYAPVPTDVIAAIRNVYPVPKARPLTVVVKPLG